MVALIAGESDAARLEARVNRDPHRLVSAISRWETVVALHRSHDYSWDEAQSAVDDFIRAYNVRFVAIGETESQLAPNAFAQFGKNKHPAALNMGDCFAAGCAIANEAWLVHKGNDFGQTHLDWIDRA